MSDCWDRIQNSAGDVLHREFDRGDFKGSVAFVNAILPLAEQAGHHPDLTISWGTVRVTLTTHSSGGVTDKDFALAEAIDDLA